MLKLKTTSHLRPLLAISICASALGACADSASEPTDVDTQSASTSRPEQPGNEREAAPRPLAQLTFPAGGSISFYEPSPGVVVVEEQGAIDAGRAPVEGEDELDAAELYEQLSGRRAPAPLIRAVARARGEEAAEVDGVDVDELVEAVPVQVAPDKSRGQLINRDDFLARFCTATDRFVSFIDAGGEHLFQTPNSDMNYFKSGAYAIQGTVRYRFNYWDAGAITYVQGTKWAGDPHFVEQGRYVWNRVDCNNCRAEAKVTAAADARFDLCINWHK